MYVYASCEGKSLGRQEEVVRLPRTIVMGGPGTNVKGGCEPQCRGKKLTSGPLHDQQVFLNTELSL